MFAFVDYTLFMQPTLIRFLLKVVVSVVLSEAYFELVENPCVSF